MRSGRKRGSKIRENEITGELPNRRKLRKGNGIGILDINWFPFFKIEFMFIYNS